MFATIVMAPTPQDCWAAITKYGRWLRVTTKLFEAARIRFLSLRQFARPVLRFRFFSAFCVPDISPGQSEGILRPAPASAVLPAPVAARSTSYPAGRGVPIPHFPLGEPSRHSPSLSCFLPVPRRPACHRFRPPHPRLRQSSLLHHLAHPSSPVHLRRPHRRDSHRYSDGSRSPPCGPTGHARLRLSFRRHAVLHASRIRFRNSSRSIRAATGSHLRPGHTPPSRRTRKTLPRRPIWLPGFCEIVFLAKAQNSGE